MTQAILQAKKVVRNPKICGGVPILEGTRLRVSDVVVAHEYRNLSPEEIVGEFPTITIADVYSALTYYYERPREIHEEIIERERKFEEYKKKQEDDRNSV